MTTTTMLVSGRWECGEGIGRKGVGRGDREEGSGEEGSVEEVGRGGCYMYTCNVSTQKHFSSFSVSAPSSLFHRCGAVHLHAVYSNQSVPDKEATSAAP